MSKVFFSHDSDARLSKKMLLLRAEHGPAGYGVYWMIVERLRSEEGYSFPKNYKMLSFDIQADEELIRSVVEDFGLFDISEDGKTFTSHGLQERMEIAEIRSEAGKKGAANRWGKNRNEMAQNGKTVGTQSDPNAIKNKRSAIKNSTSISPSYNSSPNGSEEGEMKEKEKILYEFVFTKNLASPEKEYNLFWEYNNSNGRVWEMMSEERKAEAIRRWQQQPAQSPRFKKEFLKFWKSVYDTMVEAGAPIEVRMDALSDIVKTAIDGKYVQILCSKRLQKLTESEEMIIKTRPLFKDYFKTMNCEAIQYFFPNDT